LWDVRADAGGEFTAAESQHLARKTRSASKTQLGVSQANISMNLPNPLKSNSKSCALIIADS
jgi:hypothetical protein